MVRARLFGGRGRFFDITDCYRPEGVPEECGWSSGTLGDRRNARYTIQIPEHRLADDGWEPARAHATAEG